MPATTRGRRQCKCRVGLDRIAETSQHQRQSDVSASRSYPCPAGVLRSLARPVPTTNRIRSSSDIACHVPTVQRAGSDVRIGFGSFLHSAESPLLAICLGVGVCSLTAEQLADRGPKPSHAATDAALFASSHSQNKDKEHHLCLPRAVDSRQTEDAELAGQVLEKDIADHKVYRCEIYFWPLSAPPPLSVLLRYRCHAIWHSC